MTTDDRPLPADVRRALDRAAAGIGRVATAAHPDCICHKRIGTMTITSMASATGEHPQIPIYGKPSDCPQHRPEKP